MFLAYYDESGDDGYPEYSSPLFVLSSVYMPSTEWKHIFERVANLRRQLRDAFGLPVKLEWHTKALLLNKKPYRELGLDDLERLEMVDRYCAAVGELDVRIVNVVIHKPIIRSRRYQVLDTCFQYSIQRIENDLLRRDTDELFMIITDEGREASMRKTARRIQRVNYIPSRFCGGPYRREIERLIEDPLAKDSKHSHFIQIADMVAFVVYLHKLAELGAGSYHNRMPAQVTPERVRCWLDLLKPSINLAASTKDPYGIVCHPAQKTPPTAH
ncbi:MAG: DUF3800 domain-containing protein [Phycisphaerae bacterium]